MKRIEFSLLMHTARAAAAAITLLLSACMAGPDFQKPAAPVSRHYDNEAEQQLGGGAKPAGGQHVELDHQPRNDWWLAFGSAQLDQMMHKAIDGNLNLDAADATIAEAREAVTATRGGLSPQLDFGAAAGRQRAAGVPTSNFYAYGPQVSFDFDLFGGTRREIEQQAALADLQKHRFDAAYLVVTGDVASQAFLLASASAQIEAVQILLANDRKNLQLVRGAHQYGSATQIDIALATTQLAQDETLLPPLAQQRDTARHALSALAGKEPGADWTAPDFDLAEFALPSNLPLSLPSELARQRPDILEAEAQLQAASGAVGVATADLYPHLDLSASISQAGPGIGALWGVAAGLTAPVFHGGTLQANRRAAVDGYKASLAVYQQTVVQSLTQVADVLQAINHDSDEYASQQRALSSAESSLRLNRDGYQAGEISLLQVLDAERAYQQALIGQIRARTALYLDTAQLSVALGGGSSGAFERRVASRNEQ